MNTHCIVNYMIEICTLEVKIVAYFAKGVLIVLCKEIFV
jgi:hypothetical protein